MATESEIKPLPVNIKSLLRSGVALTSVAQCVEEMVLNSVDAGATCIAVRVDMSCLKIQVLDNGSGMSISQMHSVGERYHTSKCHTLGDLENLSYFGYRGEALASLKETSSILEIVSRTKSSTISYCKLFQKGKASPVIESAVPRPSMGTTITLHDLFYNLPVRKKSMNENLEFEKVRQKMEAIALVRPDISFSMRNDVTGNVVVQTHKTSSILNTFSVLFGKAKSRNMKQTKNEIAPFSVEAYISTDTSSRKDHQFIYVNKRLVLKTKLHKSMNYLLGKSTLLKPKLSFSLNTDKSESPQKLSDRYAMFIICVTCPFCEYDITLEPAKTLIEFKQWMLLRNCLEGAVMEFLSCENLLSVGQMLVTSISSQKSSQIKGDSQDCESNAADDGDAGLGNSVAEVKQNGSSSVCGNSIPTSSIQNSRSSKCVTRVKKTESMTEEEVPTEVKDANSTSKVNSISNHFFQRMECSATNHVVPSPTFDHSLKKSEFSREESLDFEVKTVSQTPENLASTISSFPPPLKACRKMLQTPVSNVQLTVECESEDPLPSQPPTSSNSSFIRITTPYHNAVRNSSLSSFKENYGSKGNTDKGYVSLGHKSLCDTTLKSVSKGLECDVNDSHGIFLQSFSEKQKLESGLIPSNTVLTSTVGNGSDNYKTSYSSNSNVDACLESCSIDFSTNGSNPTKQKVSNIASKRPSEENTTTAAKLAKLVKKQNDAIVCRQELDVNCCPKFPLNLDNDAVDDEENVRKEREAREIVIPVSLQLGFQIKKKASYPMEISPETSKTTEQNFSASESKESGISLLRHSVLSGEHEYVKSKTERKIFQTSETLVQSRQNMQMDVDEFSKVSDRRHGVVVDMNEDYEERRFYTNVDKSVTCDNILTKPNAQDITSLAVNDNDPDELSPNDLICYESFDTSVIETESLKTPPGSDICPLNQNQSQESEGSRASTQIFKTGLDKRENLKLSLTSFAETTSKFGSSLGFSTVSPDKSQDDTPTKDWDSASLVPQFEQRQSNSPEGSEGFTPCIGDVDTELNLLLPALESDDNEKQSSSNSIPRHETENSLSVASIQVGTVNEDVKIAFEGIDDMSPGSLIIERYLDEESDFSSFRKQDNVGNSSLGKLFSSKSSDLPVSDDLSGKENVTGLQKQQTEYSHNIKENKEANVMHDENKDIEIAQSSIESISPFSDTGENDMIEALDSVTNAAKSGDRLDGVQSETESGGLSEDTEQIVSKSGTDDQIGLGYLHEADIWMKMTKSGKEFYVNTRTGHTVHDTNFIPPKSSEDTNNYLIVNEEESTSSSKPISSLSPTSHNALLQMMEDHFDEDEEMVTVKLKEKTQNGNLYGTESGKSVEDLFEEWDNPVFKLPDQEVKSIQMEKERTQAAIKAQRSLNPCKFTKDMLQNIKVLGQVDNKFIACLLCNDKSNMSADPSLMVVFDQHAVHERVRLEDLTKGIYLVDEDSEETYVKSYVIVPEVTMVFCEEDVRIMTAFISEFKRIGVSFTACKKHRDKVYVQAIPECIAERETVIKKRQKSAVVWDLVETLIKEYVELLRTTKGARGRLPSTIHKVLCSQACHGAIKFGDPLTLVECESLLQALSKCSLPFQCAHGRPSVMPLLQMDKFLDKSTKKRPNLWKIGKHCQPDT